MLFKKRKKLEVWDKMFSDVSVEQVSLAKKMAFQCIHFHDILCQSEILIHKSTNGQRYETIAFLKTFHYHLITRSQIVHNLCYAFLFEFFYKYHEETINDVIYFLDSIKFCEKYYMENYLEDEEIYLDLKKKYTNFDDYEIDEDFYPLSGIMQRYYDRMKKFQNDNPNTHISISFEDFRQIVGEQLERLHFEYL